MRWRKALISGATLVLVAVSIAPADAAWTDLPSDYALPPPATLAPLPQVSAATVEQVAKALRGAKNPLLLLGGGKHLFRAAAPGCAATTAAAAAAPAGTYQGSSTARLHRARRLGGYGCG